MKNPDSLQSYKHANMKAQDKMSDIVNRNPGTDSNVLVPTRMNEEFDHLVLDDWAPILPATATQTAAISSTNNITPRPSSMPYPAALQGLFQNCQINNLHIHLK